GALADHEQNAALAVALFEAGTGYLEVLQTLMTQSGTAAYADCQRPGGRPSETLLSRVGGSLRTIAAVERLTEILASKNYARPQTTRIARARQGFRAARHRILGRASDLASCRNPLGISEGDLPLFFGDAQGSSGRYFASSDYLLALAQPAIAQA